DLMVRRSRTEEQVEAALRALEDASATDAEKSEMLMEIAMGLQQKPQTPEDLLGAIKLYEMAMERCLDGQELLRARIQARMGTAYMMLPAEDAGPLQQARDAFLEALLVLNKDGGPEEIAETEMNLGLAFQNLASVNLASIQDAISAYQRSLRTFDRQRHPQEFAILQNNLATAFLSIPFTDEKAKMREALAVQSFEEGLKTVNLIDHPVEYAMLQNNLGNALQYASSSHRVENGFRALEAYDEALRVRDVKTMPGEYANTISNKANCLANLPDDPENPEAGNPKNKEGAISLYKAALATFERLGEMQKVQAVSEAIAELSSFEQGADASSLDCADAKDRRREAV
ncbi:MAG: hypothetical protein RIC50_13160, partial [Rhodospirillales bacterium]